jgi:hypothetical protein
MEMKYRETRNLVKREPTAYVMQLASAASRNF